MCISLPLGAVVYNAETHQQLADLVKAGEHIIVLRGGRGGRGNHHFRSSTYRSPRFSQKGESGQNLTLHIELRLIADIGLVGAPNAGKSTLLACLTNSPAKIGCYPFTTLTPNLGVLRLEYQELIIADLPGFIEGASKGAGLGIRFLKHASRTRYLAFVIEATDMQPKQTYEGLLQEIRNFSVELAEKSHLIILSKADLLTAQEQKNQDNAVIFPAVQTFLVSSHTHYNIEPLKKAFFSFNHGEKA